MKKPTKTFLLASTLAFGLSASPIYMSTQPGQAGSVNQIAILDPLTGNASSVHSTLADGSAVGLGIANGASLEFYDIAINSINEIYGVSSPLAGTQQLWKINGATGIAQLIVANMSGAMPTINGLAFNPANGLLYLAGSSGTIFSTNVSACGATCTFAAANTTALPFNSRGDIEFFNGSLFLAAEDDKLYRLDNNGTTFVQAAVSPSALTALSVGFTLKGLASNGTNLFVGGDTFSGAGGTQAVALINPTTLTISGIQPIIAINSNVAGMAGSAAVPEPATIMLSALGLALAVFGRRKISKS